MCAADIIVIDFQLWFRVDRGIGPETKIFITQLSVTVFRPLVYMNAAIEGGFAAVSNDVVNALTAGGVRVDVLVSGLVVEV